MRKDSINEHIAKENPLDGDDDILDKILVLPMSSLAPDLLKNGLNFVDEKTGL